MLMGWKSEVSLLPRKIQIVKPLTKEAISKGNKGGRNWGADNGAKLYQIETIESRK
jgi:hypothetical protein